MQATGSMHTVASILLIAVNKLPGERGVEEGFVLNEHHTRAIFRHEIARNCQTVAINSAHFDIKIDNFKEGKVEKHRIEHYIFWNELWFYWKVLLFLVVGEAAAAPQRRNGLEHGRMQPLYCLVCTTCFRNFKNILSTNKSQKRNDFIFHLMSAMHRAPAKTYKANEPGFPFRMQFELGSDFDINYQGKRRGQRQPRTE